MSDFSQRDLLILSNFLYFNCSTSANEKTIGETIDKLKNGDGSFDLANVYKQGAICVNMSEEEALDILTRIDNDEKLRNLHVARKLEEHDIRGVLFANEDESSACVIFRGTGGTYDAWHDNVRGEYESDTKLQKIASDFVKFECAQFNNLSVSGHSKGGNLAQYVAITCGSKIAACVSFDGQGFSKEFFLKYSEDIKNSRTKITSVCAYNDYVNILLDPVAGKRIFLRNDGTMVDGHSSATLLNTVVFNEDGSIDEKQSKTIQGPLALVLENITGNAVDIIDMLPNDGPEKASNIIAALVAGLMSYDKSDDYKKGQFLSALKAFGSYSSNMIDLVSVEAKPSSILYEKTGVNPDALVGASKDMDETASKILFIIERTEELMNNLDYEITGRIFTEKALYKVIEKMTGNREKLLKHSEILLRIAKIYASDEEELTGALTTRKYAMT